MPKTLSELHALLGLLPDEQIPREYYVAHLNSQKLTLRIQPPKCVKGRPGRRLPAKQKKIQWGKATFHKNKQKTIAHLSDKIDQEIISGPIFEKFIYPLITTNNQWEISPCGTPQSLSAELSKVFLPRELFIADMKKIMRSLQLFLPAVLGYRSSWKIKPSFDEQKWNPYERKWEKTGEKILIAPKLRLYLIKVVKDEQFAATRIQAIWRRTAAKRYIMCYRFLLCFSYNLFGRLGDNLK